jgi:hypothetical protein
LTVIGFTSPRTPLTVIKNRCLIPSAVHQGETMAASLHENECRKQRTSLHYR